MLAANVGQRVGATAEPNQKNTDAGINAAHQCLAAAHKS